MFIDTILLSHATLGYKPYSGHYAANQESHLTRPHSITLGIMFQVSIIIPHVFMNEFKAPWHSFASGVNICSHSLVGTFSLFNPFESTSSNRPCSLVEDSQVQPRAPSLAFVIVALGAYRTLRASVISCAPRTITQLSDLEFESTDRASAPAPATIALGVCTMFRALENALKLQIELFLSVFDTTLIRMHFASNQTCSKLFFIMFLYMFKVT